MALPLSFKVYFTSTELVMFYVYLMHTPTMQGKKIYISFYVILFMCTVQLNIVKTFNWYDKNTNKLVRERVRWRERKRNKVSNQINWNIV